MTRIGIITLVNVGNYGAELQAFATQKILENLGYDSEIIDYPYYKDKRFKSTKGSEPVFHFSKKEKFLEWIYPKVMMLWLILHYSKAIKKRDSNFKSFHKKYTKFSQEYLTAEALSTIPMIYDAYVVGSDQVWNPNNYTSLDPYFLKFAPDKKVKLSYASSFGVATLPEHTHKYYKAALQQLQAISVREENAIEIVRNISGRDAQCVLDPTLLLNKADWEKVACKVEGIPQSYLLIYEVTPCSYVKVVAKNIASVLNLKIVRITKDAVRREKDSEILNILDAGPSEFVWLFINSSFVVTNSFHGTAFSINFNKDFLVVTPQRKSNNSRQVSLLKKCGLESRLVREGGDLSSLPYEKIDFRTVNSLLDIERNNSINYLNESINGKGISKTLQS